MADHVIDIAINGRFLAQATTGVQRVARELTREIDHLIASGEAPFRARLLCPPGADTSELGLKAIAVEEVPGASGVMWEQATLPRATNGSFLLCLGNSAPLSMLIRRRPVALMIHDLSFRMFPEAYTRSYRLAHTAAIPLLRRADPIITVSETEKRRLSEPMGNAARRIVVAPNGGWPSTAGAGDDQIANGGPRSYGLYVGSLSQRKNFHGALAAAIRLAREDGLHFHIVGSKGAILAGGESIVPEDVADKIHFLGHVEDLAKLADVYRGAKYLLFPSFYESSGLPPLEAMHFGCPVIVSDIETMRERCGEAALYCDPNDVDTMVAAVRSITEDPARATELATRGLECARLYSWRRQAGLVLDAIRASHSARGRA